MKFLKKAADFAPKKSAKYLLHEHLGGFGKGRSLKTLHASELTKPEGLCPRMYALSDVVKVNPKDEWLSTSQVMTFQIGRDQEENIVNWFADMGRAICHWKCVACGTTHEFCSRPIGCKECGTKAFKPKEVRFVSAINGASCGVDMLLNMGEGKLRPFELKTMDKDEFKALLAPLAEHKLRTNFYLRIIDESASQWSSLINTNKAGVLYTSKGGFGVADPELKKWNIPESFSPFKEWEVTRDDEATDYLAERAQIVHDYRAGKIGMPQGLCKTAFDKRAQGCVCKKPCWSGDHPVKHMWKTS